MIFFILIVLVLLTVLAFLFQLQASFGSSPAGARLERIKQSPQYRDGSFVNTSFTPMMSKEVSYWDLLKLYIFKKNPTEPTDSLPSKVENYQGPVTSAPEVTWFGHSTYLIRYSDFNLLIDPVFSIRASPVTYAGSSAYNGTQIFSLDQLPDIHCVIITHDHYDHLDYETMLQLAPGSCKFVVPLGVGAHLNKWGIGDSRIHELDWWDHLSLNNNLKITATPARHFSGRKMTGRNQTLWASFLIQHDSTTIYAGGDSGYDKHFKEIGEKFSNIDLAILECGQYNSAWPFIHMMPEETIQAYEDLDAKILLPVHWSKFTLALHGWKEPMEKLSKIAGNKQLPLATPMLGQTFRLGQKYAFNHWWESIH